MSKIFKCDCCGGEFNESGIYKLGIYRNLEASAKEMIPDYAGKIKGKDFCGSCLDNMVLALCLGELAERKPRYDVLTPREHKELDAPAPKKATTKKAVQKVEKPKKAVPKKATAPRKSYRKLSAEDKLNICEDFEKGIKIPELVKKYNSSNSTVDRILTKEGLK